MSDQETEEYTAGKMTGASQSIQHGELGAERGAERSLKHEMLRGLSAVMDDVAANWRAADYPPDMQRQREQFRHAHTHAVKALGKIAAIIDAADHDRLKDPEALALLDELPKLIADLVRCAAKLAETAPREVVFSLAYVNRAEQLARRWATHRATR